MRTVLEREKRYVPVVVRFDQNGKIRPLEIEFDVSLKSPFWLLTTLYQHNFVKAKLSVISFDTGWTSLLGLVTGMSDRLRMFIDAANNGVVIFQDSGTNVHFLRFQRLGQPSIYC